MREDDYLLEVKSQESVWGPQDRPPQRFQREDGVTYVNLILLQHNLSSARPVQGVVVVVVVVVVCAVRPCLLQQQECRIAADDEVLVLYVR